MSVSGRLSHSEWVKDGQRRRVTVLGEQLREHRLGLVYAAASNERETVRILERRVRGALGIVVNRPIDVTLSALFRQVEIPLGDGGLGAQPVFFGGPVQFDHGFVLHRPVGAWKSTLPVGEIGLTTSRDILEAMAGGHGPRQQLVALGYAGWAPGQLEDEIQRNGWLTVRADIDLIFNVPPDARYDAAMHALGINAANLSEEAGHA